GVGIRWQLWWLLVGPPAARAGGSIDAGHIAGGGPAPLTTRSSPPPPPLPPPPPPPPPPGLSAQRTICSRLGAGKIRAWPEAPKGTTSLHGVPRPAGCRRTVSSASHCPPDPPALDRSRLATGLALRPQNATVRATGPDAPPGPGPGGQPSSDSYECLGRVPGRCSGTNSL